jgi:hypothetical protein
MNTRTMQDQKQNQKTAAKGKVKSKGKKLDP